MHFDRWYARKKRGLPDEVCNDVERDLRETFIYDMEPEEELANLIYEQEREMRYKDFAYPGTGESRVVVSHSAPLNDDGFDLLDALEFEQAETNLYGGRRKSNAERASDW